jgi:hypothetical protein
MAIAIVDIPEVPTGEGIALDVVDPTLLDLALVLGRARSAGAMRKP